MDGGSMMVKQRENRELKGQAIMGRVFKLSNWGWSIHERFLKLNKKGLCYFSAPPPEVEGRSYTKVEDIEDLGDEYKPKLCVPLTALVSVEDISADDRKKYKKFYQAKSG